MVFFYYLQVQTYLLQVFLECLVHLREISDFVSDFYKNQLLLSIFFIFISKSFFFIQTFIYYISFFRSIKQLDDLLIFFFLCSITTYHEYLVLFVFQLMSFRSLFYSFLFQLSLLFLPLFFTIFLFILYSLFIVLFIT